MFTLCCENTKIQGQMLQIIFYFTMFIKCDRQPKSIDYLFERCRKMQLATMTGNLTTGLNPTPG